MACSWPRTCAGCGKLDRLEAEKAAVCYSCRFFGPDIDLPVCGKYMENTRPCQACGAWEGGDGNGERTGG